MESLRAKVNSTRDVVADTLSCTLVVFFFLDFLDLPLAKSGMSGGMYGAGVSGDLGRKGETARKCSVFFWARRIERRKIVHTAQHLIRVAGKVRHVNRLKSKPAVTAALVRGGCLNDSSSVRQEVDRLVQLPARGGFGLIHPAGVGAAARDEPE